MRIWGLHVIDIAIVAAYLVGVMWLGKRVSRRARDSDSFFLANRSLGKTYQFFLNFGCSTNADQAVAVSREVFRQGIGGMWIQFVVLFLTPFYWFTVLFFRRVRLTTIGDFYTERFNSKVLGAGYAIFTLVLTAFIGGGVGFMVAGKTMMAMTPKSIEECTLAERTSITEFQKLHALQARDQATLAPSERARLTELQEKDKKGELRSFVSHVDRLWFYLTYAVVVGTYTILGGFRAAALTDALQGILILIFSVLLVPIGLSHIGGFAGLHGRVPEYMFAMFGSASMSDYAWYTVLAMVLANLVSIVAVVSSMQTAGSAKDEWSARIGMIGGMFAKRVLMLCWALAGLIAVAVYAGRLHDPDLIWGVMTRDLLGPGATGLMLVGVLAATMSALGAAVIAYSALFVRNLYKPFVPDRSDRHYLVVGRVVIAVALAGAVAVAMLIDNLLVLYQYIISLPAIFGASIWLGFLWRRVTTWAVIVQVLICVAVYAVVPNVFPHVAAVAENPAYLHETAPRGAANTRSAPIFFERVARSNPADPTSPKVGLGRFHAEIWILSGLGVDFSGFNKAQLVAVRFAFDAVFPFVLLFLLSYLTPRIPRRIVDRFFARLHTPVETTPERDGVAVSAAYDNPGRYERDKLMPGSQWEIMKPSRQDVAGFGGTWLLVGLVLVLLWVMVTVR